MKYNYLWHIHTKKHDYNEVLGKYWQNYLYDNLLCNEIIIKQILQDFENNDKLGFIFYQHFISIIQNANDFKTKNLIQIDKMFDISFPNLNIRADNVMNFPAFNIF